MISGCMAVAMVPVLFVLQQSAADGRLVFTAPAEWTSRPPQSSMRVAEYQLPPTEGDTEPADLVVYYFGGSGGSVDANIERWIGQMTQPDGRDSKAAAKRESRTINTLPVTQLDVSGTYVAEMTPGSTERHNKPFFRMRAAVVETPRGPYYVKLVGPEKTVARWGDGFAAFIESMRFEK
jgi:hypothetical protein